MSGYHSFELCYLAAVYGNLLINQQPMDFHFKVRPGTFKDNILRVQPDILPSGSVRLEDVWINGDRYTDFDPVAMTVKLPMLSERHPLQQRYNRQEWDNGEEKSILLNSRSPFPIGSPAHSGIRYLPRLEESHGA